MTTHPEWLTVAVHEELVHELVRLHGDGARARAATGVAQLAGAWRDDDGDLQALRAFVSARFVPDGPRYAALLARCEDTVFNLRGHLSEIHRALQRWRDVAGYDDPGIDDLLAQFNPAPDLDEELYRAKLALVMLLNFPRRTFEEQQAHGAHWTADEWAAVRIADAIPHRLPRAINDLARSAFHRAREFYYNFHIPVGCIVAADGSQPFPAGKTLLAHWLLREELRSHYGAPHAESRQRLLARVMGRHIDGSIPQRVMSGAAQRWCPVSNRVDDGEPGALTGPRRYAVWHELFQLARQTDPYYPEYPTHIDRALTMHNQLGVDATEALLRALLEAPVRREVMQYVAARLGRPLEAFDLYYNNVAPPEPAEALHAAVAARFPRFESFQEQLPQILRALGFTKATAAFLAAHIQTEAARGSGHASPARLYPYRSYLRTNHAQGQSNWPALTTAMHELGHCIEQVFSLHRVPRPALIGVPNLGVTEGMAFTFQEYARAVVGVPYPPNHQAISTLTTYLTACEIAGAGLVDLLVWRWLYAHPDATPEALQDATLRTAGEVWQRYYQPYLGADENHLLAAYQHMIGMMLYLPNYTVGHVIAHMVRRHMTPRTLAREVERMCAQGDVTPDVWLTRAVGHPLSAQPLIDDVGAALVELGATQTQPPTA